KIAAVALVADDLVLAAQQGAALQLGAHEDPMIRAVDRVSARPVLEQVEEAMVTAPREADASQLVLRPADQPMAPHAAEQLVLFAVVERVFAEVLLEARERPAVAFRAHLPEGRVAAEE